jgi:uncharacterized membrane protein YtjA (UPF0391 family)
MRIFRGILLGTSPALNPLVPPAAGRFDFNNLGGVMLHWAAVFFVIALIAALFGFGGIAAGAASIAKVLFVLFIILAIVALIMGRRAPI